MGEHTQSLHKFHEVGMEHENPLWPEALRHQLGAVSLENLRLAETAETHPYQRVEENLKHAIIGQDEAIESIVTSLNRNKLRNPRRPVANLLFLGPTGVGKSESAKELALQLNAPFLKLDGSSYANPISISALVGAAPSYVGREQAPLLDPAIIEQPNCIVLVDEIEKACREFHDLLLQIMDEGELMVTGTGRMLSFRKSIIIATSNLGASEMMGLLDPKRVGFSATTTTAGGDEKTKEQIDAAAKGALKNVFRPELINRFDRQVVFKPLSDDNLGQVLDRYVEFANRRYEHHAGVSLTMSPTLRQGMVTQNADRFQFGARPILRQYDHKIESLLATHLNTGTIPEGSRVYAVAPNDLPPEVAHETEDVLFLYEPDERLHDELAQRRAAAAERQAAEEAEKAAAQASSGELVPVQ